MLMRTIVLATLILFAGCANTQLDKQPNLRLVSYNIRLDTPEDGNNSWRHRKPGVVALLNFFAPDVTGLQEVLPDQLNDLKHALDHYIFIGKGRDGTLDEAEWAPIAFRADRFDLLQDGIFWLSETPSVPSIGWDATLPRTATWARLKDRKTDRSMLVINTHWDHLGSTAREQSGQLIKSWISQNKRSCEPIFLLGDLNATTGEPAFQNLVRWGDDRLTNSITVSQTPPFGPSGTFNGFDLRGTSDEAIDHVLFKGHMDVVRHGVITQHANGRLPSDHYPVLVDTILRPCQRLVKLDSERNFKF